LGRKRNAQWSRFVNGRAWDFQEKGEISKENAKTNQRKKKESNERPLLSEALLLVMQIMNNKNTVLAGTKKPLKHQAKQWAKKP